jgi:uncharacterized protein
LKKLTAMGVRQLNRSQPRVDDPYFDGLEVGVFLLLYEWIVRTAREYGLAGATVLRGVEGFGANSRVRTAKILELSTDLPIIVEIVDTAEKIERFLAVIDGAIKDGLATVERVQIRFYRSGQRQTAGTTSV